MVYRKIESLSHILMQSWAECMRVSLCSSDNEHGKKRWQIWCLSISWWIMAGTLRLLSPKSSDIQRKNTRRLFNSIYRTDVVCTHICWGSTWTWFVIYGFLSLRKTFKPVLHAFFTQCVCSVHLDQHCMRYCSGLSNLY